MGCHVERVLPAVKRFALTVVFATCVGLLAWVVWHMDLQEPPRTLLTGLGIVRPPHDVSVLLVEANEVWAGGVEGLWVVDRQTRLARPAFAAGDGPRHVHALLRDRDGSLLVGHDAGLTRLIGGKLVHPDVTTSPPQGKVLSLLITRGGVLWVGTDRGAAVREGNAWRMFHAADGLASDVVETMTEDQDGGIWFGSYNVPAGGVSRFHAGRWQRWTPGDGLPHASVTALCGDGASRMLVGTGLLDRGGLAVFEKTGGEWQIVRVIRQLDGPAGAKVRSLFKDRNERLWVGSEYDGLALRSPAGWKILRTADGLSHDEIKAIGQDADGSIWLGTKDGITVIEENAL